MGRGGTKGQGIRREGGEGIREGQGAWAREGWMDRRMEIEKGKWLHLCVDCPGPKWKWKNYYNSQFFRRSYSRLDWIF